MARLKHPLVAGSYDLVLIAECGSREGRSLVTVLELRATRKGDRSPKTGALAEDWDLSNAPLSGWIDAGLDWIGAPVVSNPLPDDPHPAPSSRDPVYPGVLVQAGMRDYAGIGLPEDAQTLLVGTLSNLRANNNWVDGGGFAMWLQAWDGRCYRGTWTPWGIARDGSGHFLLCPVTIPKV